MDSLVNLIHQRVKDLDEPADEFLDEWIYHIEHSSVDEMKQLLRPPGKNIDTLATDIFCHISLIDAHIQKLHNPTVDHLFATRAKNRRLLTVLVSLHRLITLEEIANRSMNSNCLDGREPLTMDEYVSFIDRKNSEEKGNEIYTLAAHFLTFFHDKGYRRWGDHVAFPRFNDRGQFTYCYERRQVDEEDENSDFITIERQVNQFLGGLACNKPLHESLMMGQNRVKVMHELRFKLDPRFMEYRMGRSCLSFRNALFNLEEVDILPYEITDDLQGLTFPLPGQEDNDNVGIPLRLASTMNHERSAYHYIDQDIDIKKIIDALRDPSLRHLPSYMRIPTPAYDKILTSQGFSEEVREWNYILFGRAFFKLKLHDNWQVAVRLWGRGRTGKSTSTEFLASCFNKGQVGYMRTDTRQGFPLQTFLPNFVVIGNDLGKNWDIEIDLFKAICSGDKMHIYVMRDGNGRNITWDKPFIFTSNEPPERFDNAGEAIDPRVIHFEHTKKVNRDPNLVANLQAEKPLWIIKCVMAYRCKALELLTQGIEDLYTPGVMPQYFTDQRELFKRQLNPLLTFIANECETGDDSLVVRMSTFNRAYKETMDHDAKRKPLCEKLYRDVFERLGVKVVNTADPEVGMSGKHLRGICLKVNPDEE